MRYIIKQKLNITDLVNLSQTSHRIILHEPEEYLAGLYMKYLLGHDFEVKHSPVLELLHEHIESFNPKLLIFNLDSNEDINIKINWLIKFLKQNPTIQIITTGFNTDSSILKKILGVGVTSHLNRKFSRPQDLVVLTKTILKS